MQAKTPKIGRFKFGLNATVYTIFFLALVVFIELASARHYTRVDTTETARYSLSPQTKKIVASLKKEITLTSFFGEENVREKAAFEELMNQYKFASGLIKYINVDPDRKPAIARLYKITNYGTVVLEYGKNEQRINKYSEESVTNAIITVTSNGKKNVYFLAGHGEKGINSIKADGYRSAKEAVEQANYETKELPLLPNLDALKDADLLIIPGPVKPLRENETQSLTTWLKQGGKLLLMIDPLEAPGLKPMLKEFGVTLNDDVIIDPMSRFFGVEMYMPVINSYHDHTITRDFNVATFFPLARSVARIEEPPEGVRVTPLLSTSSDSWAEADLTMLEQGKAAFDKGKDRRGPLDLGVAVTIDTAPKKKKEGEEARPQKPERQGKKKKTGRVVVIGDSDFAANSRINMVGNRDFFLNVVSWLAEDTDLISIRPRDQGGSLPTPLTEYQQHMILYVPVIIWPLFVALIGVAIHRRRKRLK